MKDIDLHLKEHYVHWFIEKRSWSSGLISLLQYEKSKQWQGKQRQGAYLFSKFKFNLNSRKFKLW